MRGEERRQQAMLMVIDAERHVPKEHPLRRIKELADAALAELSPLFEQMYSEVGRPSIPPERLLKSLAADGAVHGAQRADVLRAAGLQPVVSLVPRPELGRAELRPFHL